MSNSLELQPFGAEITRLEAGDSSALCKSLATGLIHVWKGLSLSPCDFK